MGTNLRIGKRTGRDHWMVQRIFWEGLVKPFPVTKVRNESWMIFRETPLEGPFIIDLEKREDERGFFSRTWCSKEYEAYGLITRVVQANTSFNKKKGTL